MCAESNANSDSSGMVTLPDDVFEALLVRGLSLLRYPKDITQEAGLRAWKGRAGFRCSPNDPYPAPLFTRWLAKITYRVLLDATGAAIKRNLSELAESNLASAGAVDGDDPARALEAAEERARFLTALARALDTIRLDCSEHELTVLGVLFGPEGILSGTSPADMARAVGDPRNSFHVCAGRLMFRLQQLLELEGFTAEDAADYLASASAVPTPAQEGGNDA